MAKTYSERIEIRLTPEQRQHFEEIATLEGLKISQIIRQRVLGEKPLKLTGIKREINQQLSRMGNNLNQIAKVLNSTALSKIPLPASEIIELKGELQVVMNEIKVLQIKLEE
jgi:hypothetical protein